MAAWIKIMHSDGAMASGKHLLIMIPYLYGGASGESADKAPKTLEAIGGGNAGRAATCTGARSHFLDGPVYFGRCGVLSLCVWGLIVVRSST